MGLEGLSIGHLLVVFAIAVVIFGTKRLQTIGSDLGSAIRSFRRAMSDDDTPPGSPGPSASERRGLRPED